MRVEFSFRFFEPILNRYRPWGIVGIVDGVSWFTLSETLFASYGDCSTRLFGLSVRYAGDVILGFRRLFAKRLFSFLRRNGCHANSNFLFDLSSNERYKIGVFYGELSQPWRFTPGEILFLGDE